MSEKIKAFKTEDEMGYWIDPNSVYTDLHNLLCIFLADEKYSKIIKGSKDPLWELASLAEKEITRILINSAIVARIIDDQKDSSSSFSAQSLECGLLIVDNKKSILTLREACNKIIHAKNIGFEITETATKYSFVESKILLTGKKNGKNWDAEINVVDYIRSYLNAMNELYPFKKYVNI